MAYRQVNLTLINTFALGDFPNSDAMLEGLCEGPSRWNGTPATLARSPPTLALRSAWFRQNNGRFGLWSDGDRFGGFDRASFVIEVNAVDQFEVFAVEISSRVSKQEVLVVSAELAGNHKSTIQPFCRLSRACNQLGFALIVVSGRTTSRCGFAALGEQLRLNAVHYFLERLRTAPSVDYSRLPTIIDHHIRAGGNFHSHGAAELCESCVFGFPVRGSQQCGNRGRNVTRTFNVSAARGVLGASPENRGPKGGR